MSGRAPFAPDLGHGLDAGASDPTLGFSFLEESYRGVSPTRVTPGTASEEGSGPRLGAPSGSTAANRCALSHAARAATMQVISAA